MFRLEYAAVRLPSAPIAPAVTRQTKLRMKTPECLEIRKLTEARLNELQTADITNLTEFAERRLSAMGLNPVTGADVTQRALAAILQGLESDQRGRVPRLVNIESKDAFLNYVRGAISSGIEAMSRKPQFRVEHEPWQDGHAGSTDPHSLSPAAVAQLSDLKAQLFQRLRARAPSRLRPTIDAWESVFLHSDRIPAPGHRRYVGEVKNLARKIVTDLGGIN